VIPLSATGTLKMPLSKGGGGGQEGEMTQALYAHMNNKTIKKRNKNTSKN
jgi:hypothetical protein